MNQLSKKEQMALDKLGYFLNNQMYQMPNMDIRYSQGSYTLYPKELEELPTLAFGKIHEPSGFNLILVHDTNAISVEIKN